MENALDFDSLETEMLDMLAATKAALETSKGAL